MPPRLQKDIFFTIAEEEYQALISSSEITSPKPVMWRGGDPETVYSDIPAAGTQLVLTGVQDWEDASGLCNYLRVNAGTQAEIVFSPRTAGQAYFAVTAILQAPAIGGKMNVFNEWTLTLDCVSGVEPGPAPIITTTTLGSLTDDVPFSLQLVATVLGAATWAVSAGTLPAGLTLSATGLLSGTPTTAGAYSFTVSATNLGGTDTQAYTGTVA